MYTHTQDLWSTYLKAQTLQNVVVIYSSHTYTHIYTHNYVSIPLHTFNIHHTRGTFCPHARRHMRFRMHLQCIACGLRWICIVKPLGCPNTAQSFTQRLAWCSVRHSVALCCSFRLLWGACASVNTHCTKQIHTQTHTYQTGLEFESAPNRIALSGGSESIRNDSSFSVNSFTEVSRFGPDRSVSSVETVAIALFLSIFCMASIRCQRTSCSQGERLDCALSSISNSFADPGIIHCVCEASNCQ